ncbi:hypothetical protein TNCV_4543121 [Trichonephila clavipes]|nr:hypothetical protein TNCV_4543121 [Trichonephila clavipes]
MVLHCRRTLSPQLRGPCHFFRIHLLDRGRSLPNGVLCIHQLFFPSPIAVKRFFRMKSPGELFEVYQAV